MSDLQELTNELMQDAAFRKEYEALQPERVNYPRKPESVRQISADWRMAQEIPAWRY